MCSQNNENTILNHSVIKKEKNDVLYVLFSACTKCFDKYMFMLWHTVYSQEISIPTLIGRFDCEEQKVIYFLQWSGVNH